MALSTILEKVVTMLRRLADTPEISLTTAATLRMLEVSGPCRLSELAISQGVTQPAMTQLVTRLERDGLAARGSDASDARVVLVDLTDGGREMLQRRRDDRTDRLSELLAALPDRDRAAILDAVPALHLLTDLGQTFEFPPR
jgi:DNA-binding MarR family transcriptional regulator